MLQSSSKPWMQAGWCRPELPHASGDVLLCWVLESAAASSPPVVKSDPEAEAAPGLLEVFACTAPPENSRCYAEPSLPVSCPALYSLLYQAGATASPASHHATSTINIHIPLLSCVVGGHMYSTCTHNLALVSGQRSIRACG